MNPIISLCLPTNGISEWVFPVLDSIYTQDVKSEMFEVIVTNNGNNNDFHELMLEYSKKHVNLTYKKTNAFMFENQLEALKLANGQYFKFINHRCPLVSNSLQCLINEINKYIETKPVIYFSNGALKNNIYNLENFDDFIKSLRRFASWTTGVGIWKDDYKKLPENLQYDKISPHSVILFSERNKNKYIIDNTVFCKEIPSDHSKKGGYDLFKTFAIEEFTITLKLFLDGDITYKTLKTVKKDYKKMITELYLEFVILHNKCSYDLSGFDDSMGIYFNKVDIILRAWFLLIPFLCKKIIKKILRK